MGKYQPIEELELFKLYESVAERSWSAVVKWPKLAQDSLGLQLVRAIDSVGANLVEGDARKGDADALRFFVYARSSAREARLWIKRAASRSLISGDEASEAIRDLEKATQMLNLLMRYRNESLTTVKEDLTPYNYSEDVLTCEL